MYTVESYGQGDHRICGLNIGVVSCAIEADARTIANTLNELSALGPVEWEIPYHGMAWQPCSELNMDCKTKRAIRRVVEPAANA